MGDDNDKNQFVLGLLTCCYKEFSLPRDVNNNNLQALFTNTDKKINNKKKESKRRL